MAKLKFCEIYPDLEFCKSGFPMVYSYIQKVNPHLEFLECGFFGGLQLATTGFQRLGLPHWFPSLHHDFRIAVLPRKLYFILWPDRNIHQTSALRHCKNRPFYVAYDSHVCRESDGSLLKHHQVKK